MSTIPGIETISDTFPPSKLEEILRITQPLKKGHFLYPADKNAPSAHLPAFFYFDTVLRHGESLPLIVKDLLQWIKVKKIEIDLLFAPNQPSVRQVIEKLSSALHTPAAYLEYLPSGRFGESIEGEALLTPGKKVLVFNGVSTTGRCVGNRLPSFVEKHEAAVSAISAFARGTDEGVRLAGQAYLDRFYSAIEVDLPLYPSDPKKCPLCLQKVPLQPWNTVLQKGVQH